MPLLDMADVKPGVQSFFVVGSLALLFIVLGKAFFKRFPVPGLSDLFGAA